MQKMPAATLVQSCPAPQTTGMALGAILVRENAFRNHITQL
jgi:hypothetical protein